MTQLRLSYIDIQLTLSQRITETLASLFLLLSYSKYRCKWNQPRHSPAEKWVQKILYVYIVEFGFEEGPHSNLGCNKTYLIAQTGLELCLLSVGITGVSLFNHKDNCNQGSSSIGTVLWGTKRNRDRECEPPTRSKGRDAKGQDDCSELLVLDQLF